MVMRTAAMRQATLGSMIGATTVLGALVAALASSGVSTFVGGLLPGLWRHSSHGRTSLAAGAEPAVPARASLVLKVLTPEGPVLRTVVEQVSLPGVEGRLDILKGHAPLIAPIGIGVLRYKKDGEWLPCCIFGGYASVGNNAITVLAGDAAVGDEIPSIYDATKQLDEATHALANAGTKYEKLQAKDELKKSSARLQAATLLAGKK
mmetsp:Transcript_47132/g.134997  ORF Transcript_47132/g.134997 Transcript_47132/m.134997 type:complete len:206 (-) Transcript_47132:210-827(-)